MDLAGCSREKALLLLQALPRKRVSLVLGWHSGRLALDDREKAELPPCILVNLSLHGFELGGDARARLREDWPDIVGGCQDPLWCERHMARLLEFFGSFARLRAESLEAFMEGLGRQGVGAAEDMLLTGPEALKVILDSPYRSRIRVWATPERFAALPPPAREAVAGLKLFLDGALGARTAAMAAPFLDGSEGILVHGHDELTGILGTIARLGKPLALHAIGERAINQALWALELLDRNGVSMPAVRLEHVQFISEPQARRARDLGLVLSMQPNFSADTLDYTDRLDATRLEVNNPFRMLLDRVGFQPGKDLILGSDGMPQGLEAALRWGLFPPCPGQRLTLEELLAGYGTCPGTARVAVDDEQGKVRLLASHPG
jgi:predicted amidohydrolase YtcJ